MDKKKKIMKWIIIVAIIVIPVMYSFFYLKAFWDPYGNLHGMKIAIVNLDKGSNNKNLGNNLVEELKEKDVMSIEVLNDSKKAEDGLINEEYYATITIPENFTQDLNSAENKDRKTTTITYSPNQKSNYLASQIIAKVVTTVETELRSEVSEKVVETLSNKLNEVPEKMQDISDGATQIKDGANQLSTGLQTLNSGTNELQVNYNKFDAGVDTAYNGSKELNNGLNQLNSGAEQLYQGTTQLENATKNLSAVTSGVNQISTGASNLSSGVSAYVNGVNTAIAGVNNTVSQVKTLGADIQSYVAKNPTVMADPNFQKIMKDLQNINNSAGNMQGLNTLKTKGNELKTGASNLNSGIQTFASQAKKLQDLQAGAKTLNTGMLELKQGLSKVQTGSNALTSGLNELSVNSKKVSTGINQLNEGSKQALDGSNELVAGTDTFKTEIDNGIQDTKEQLTNLEGLDEYVANPVKIEEKDYAQVNSYGLGFAPYFMSISLWVGGLIMLVMLYNDPEDRYKLLGKNAKNKYLRTALYIGIAGIQGVVLGFLLKLGLGFNVTNMWLYYGTCILISMVFTSIVQFLIVNFGDVGKFLCILLLVLQLAASGGTFPIETVPEFFQNIYSVMPMNYTIRLIKEALININVDMVIGNITVLVGIFVVFTGLTVLLDFIRNKRNKKNKNIINENVK